MDDAGARFEGTAPKAGTTRLGRGGALREGGLGESLLGDLGDALLGALAGEDLGDALLTLAVLVEGFGAALVDALGCAGRFEPLSIRADALCLSIVNIWAILRFCPTGICGFCITNASNIIRCRASLIACLARRSEIYSWNTLDEGPAMFLSFLVS